jgi:hypothetical protein
VPFGPDTRESHTRIDLHRPPERAIHGDTKGHRTMNRTTTAQTITTGFAIELLPDTDLGSAMLIAEDEEGHYAPVGIVLTISEGREIAENDLRCRMNRLERGEDAGLCPSEYNLWARGLWGAQHIAATWNASEL